MNDKKSFKWFMRRVDIKVSLIVMIFTISVVAITATVYWTLTYEVMMKALEERVYALYHAIEGRLDMDTFQYINIAEDMESDLYRNSKEVLLEMKNSAGVMYLYTAKENEDGNFIYVLDGLEEEQDFRFPGDPIEEAIVDDMKLALSGVDVISEEIYHTDWGDIYIAYLPVHNQRGEILGVVGIEFEAGLIYDTQSRLLNITYFVIMATIVLAGGISVIVFRRISSPIYLDMATKDLPTGLKNRNSYDMDLNTMIVKNKMENVGIVMIDINGLKMVNDQFGHSIGDEYIRAVGDAIKITKTKDAEGYRIGGDEFIIIMQDTEQVCLEDFIVDCSKLVRDAGIYEGVICSIACGWAIYDEAVDKTLEDTCLRADEKMYIEKREKRRPSL